MRYTEYHCGVAVIKDKALLKDAMQKLAKIEDEEEIPELRRKVQNYCDNRDTCDDYCVLYKFCSEKIISMWDLKKLREASRLIDALNER